MNGFTLVDAVALAITLLSAILAYNRGVIREVLSIAGWIFAALIAYAYGPLAQPLVEKIPLIGPFLQSNCELSILAASLGVFVLTLMVTSLITPALSKLFSVSFLGGIDQALGFLFGVLRAVALIIVALVFYNKMMAPNAVPMIDNSSTARIFSGLQLSVEDMLPSSASQWLIERYQTMTASCTTAPTPAIISN